MFRNERLEVMVFEDIIILILILKQSYSKTRIFMYYEMKVTFWHGSGSGPCWSPKTKRKSELNSER